MSGHRDQWQHASPTRITYENTNTNTLRHPLSLPRIQGFVLLHLSHNNVGTLNGSAGWEKYKYSMKHGQASAAKTFQKHNGWTGSKKAMSWYVPNWYTFNILVIFSRKQTNSMYLGWEIESIV